MLWCVLLVWLVALVWLVVVTLTVVLRGAVRVLAKCQFTDRSQTARTHA